jgi:hypothetical protein
MALHSFDGIDRKRLVIAKSKIFFATLADYLFQVKEFGVKF